MSQGSQRPGEGGYALDHLAAAMPSPSTLPPLSCPTSPEKRRPSTAPAKGPLLSAGSDGPLVHTEQQALLEGETLVRERSAAAFDPDGPDAPGEAGDGLLGDAGMPHALVVSDDALLENEEALQEAAEGDASTMADGADHVTPKPRKASTKSTSPERQGPGWRPGGGSHKGKGFA
eukprot:4314038-Prymnesium_polylepis.1